LIVIVIQLQCCSGEISDVLSSYIVLFPNVFSRTIKEITLPYKPLERTACIVCAYNVFGSDRA